MTPEEQEEVSLDLAACTFAPEAALPGWHVVPPEEFIGAGYWVFTEDGLGTGSQFRSASVFLEYPGMWALLMPTIRASRACPAIMDRSPRTLMRAGSTLMADRSWLFKLPLVTIAELPGAWSLFPTLESACELCKAARTRLDLRLPPEAVPFLSWIVCFDAICGLSRVFIAVRDGAADADILTWNFTEEKGWGPMVRLPAPPPPSLETDP